MLWRPRSLIALSLICLTGCLGTPAPSPPCRIIIDDHGVWVHDIGWVKVLQDTETGEEIVCTNKWAVKLPSRTLRKTENGWVIEPVTSP